MKTMKGIFCLMAVSAMLTACGGGGGGDGGGVAQAATVPAATPTPADSFNGYLVGENYAGSADVFVKFGNYPFLGGSIFAVDTSFPDGTHSQMTMSNPPNWTGTIVFKNNTTGVSVTFSKTNATTWIGANPANLIRIGMTDSFTVTPSQ